MGRFAILDCGVPFDGRAIYTRPLGGAEGAVISLASALNARGHEVIVCNSSEREIEHNGVSYRPIEQAADIRCDRYIVNRSPQLLNHVPRDAASTLWLHNDARYLRKLRYSLPLMRGTSYVVLSDYHADTLAGFSRASQRSHIIPLGVDDWFRAAEEAPLPPPRAVFASNPERGLSELLDVWVERIHPAVPEAELHLFTRADFYGLANKASRFAEPLMAYAASLRDYNVILREMAPRPELAAIYRDMRVMLYWGDAQHAETFCLSVAEAQAAGLPCVARPIGALTERVQHKRTGFLEMQRSNFAEAAIALLSDGDLWQSHHAQALSRGAPGWDAAAARFEELHA